jgi:hypothetical protein
MQRYLETSIKPKRRSVANSIQRKATATPVFQLVDNRASSTVQKNLFQQKHNSQIIQRQVIQFGKIKYGDSAKLARARFRAGGGKRRKGIDFKKWKRGREAQHLIPAQVCRDYGIPKSWANSAVNGMMLPSGRRTTNHLRIKRLDKGKMHHIKGGGSHPQYNKYAFKMAKQQKWKRGKVTKIQFDKLARYLRKKNRPRRSGPAKGYINDLK